MIFKHKRYISSLIGAIFIAVTSSAFAAEAVALTLDESIHLALKNNKQIKAAASGVEVAKWNLEKTKGGKGITVDLVHSDARIGGNYWQVYHIDESPSNYFVNSVTASMPVYTGGRIESTIKQAKMGSEISELQLQNTKQDIKYQVTSNYHYILACQHFQQVKEEAVKQLTEHLKNVELQYSVGAVTKADVLRSEVELANARQGLVTARLNLFDGNVTNADVKASQGKLEQIKHQAGDMSSAVELSVQQAYLTMIKSERNIATTKVAVDKATEDFALAQARYSVNLYTNLDVVDAQVALTSAKTSYFESLYDYNVSKAALDKAMGKAVEVK